MIRFSALAVVTAAALAAPVAAQIQPLPVAVDDNPDPRVFETVLVAAEREVQVLPGRKTRMMTYNGSTPGPTLEVEVGDRVIVHLVNLLPSPTSIHWHGVETPADMDGSQLAQAAVPRSGHFRYEFVASNAGTYWYHPHFETNEQVERGLFGMLIVRDPQQDRDLGIPQDRDHLVVLDDIRLDEDNQIAPFATDPRSEFVPWQRAEDLVNSRVGNHLMINGRRVDATALQTLEVLAGKGYRLRFLSASSGYLWRLSIPGKHAKWFGIGSDQGLWAKSERIPPIDQVKDFRGHHDLLISDIDRKKGLILTPGDRFETVLVAEGDAGTKFCLEAHDYIKGKHIAYRDPTGGLGFGHDHFDGAEKPVDVLCFQLLDFAGPRQDDGDWTPTDTLRTDPVEELKVDLSKPPLPVFFGHSLPQRESGDVMFFLNVERPMDLLAAVRSKQAVLPIDFGPLPMMKLGAGDGYHVKIGETRYWEVVNFTGSAHNFHVHGFPFQHIDTTYVDLDEPANNRTEQPMRLANEDTIRVPQRPGLVLGRSYTVMRLATRFSDAGRPPALRRRPDQLVAGGLAPGFRTSGGWLLHCHFLEHSRKGMQSFVTVTR